MKKYFEFFNEMNRFNFSIDLEGSDFFKRKILLNKLNNNMEIYNHQNEILFDDRVQAIALEIYTNTTEKTDIYNTQITTTLSKTLFKQNNPYTENIIPIDDFLKVGLKGILEYFEIKNNANKYNL